MPKLSYKERARRRREQEILRTAARMIRDSGYNNLNMDDLAEEVGISKPTLYQHFKGKDDMVARTMLQTMQEMADFIDGLDGDDAMHQLEQIMHYMLNAHANPDGFSVSIVHDATTTLQHLSSDNTEIEAIKQRIGHKLYSLVRAAKAAGSIRADLPDVVVVGCMFSLLTVLRAPAIMHDYETTPNQLISHIMRLFRQSIAPVAASATE